MDHRVREVAKILDPAERAQQASELVTALRKAAEEAAQVRRAAINELLERGISQLDIAQLLGLTKGRLSQILRQGR